MGVETQNAGEEDHTRDGESPCNHSIIPTTIRRYLVSIERHEALRLIQVYNEAVGVLYPCVDLVEIESHAMDLWDSVKPGQNDSHSDEDGLLDRNSEVLKVIIAIALVHEGNGFSEQGSALMDSVGNAIWRRMKVPEVDTKELLIFTLMVSPPLYIFYFTFNDIHIRVCTISSAMKKH